MQQQELKNCPFCGEQPELEETICDYIIRCTNKKCRAQMIYENAPFDVSATLSYAWNTRPQPDTAGLVERLTKAYWLLGNITRATILNEGAIIPPSLFESAHSHFPEFGNTYWKGNEFKSASSAIPSELFEQTTPPSHDKLIAKLQNLREQWAGWSQREGDSSHGNTLRDRVVVLDYVLEIARAALKEQK